MARKSFPSHNNKGSILTIFASIIVIALIIITSLALIFAIEYPHRIEEKIILDEQEVEAHGYMARLSKALEQYQRDFGKYTDRKLLLRRYDVDADMMRCPRTFEPYQIELDKTPPPDTTYNIMSPYPQFGSIVNGIRTWNGRPVIVPPDTTKTEEGKKK